MASARAISGFVDSIEAIEDARHLVGRNDGPRVDHADLGDVSTWFCMHGHPAPLLRVSAGVLQQIDEHLNHMIRFGLHRDRVGHDHVDADVTAIQGRGSPLDGGLHYFPEIDPFR